MHKKQQKNSQKKIQKKIITIFDKILSKKKFKHPNTCLTYAKKAIQKSQKKISIFHKILYKKQTKQQFKKNQNQIVSAVLPRREKNVLTLRNKR